MTCESAAARGDPREAKTESRNCCRSSYRREGELLLSKDTLYFHQDLFHLLAPSQTAFYTIAFSGLRSYTAPVQIKTLLSLLCPLFHFFSLVYYVRKAQTRSSQHTQIGCLDRAECL